MVCDCKDIQGVSLDGIEDGKGKLAQYELPDRGGKRGPNPGIFLYQLDCPFDLVAEARPQAADLGIIVRRGMKELLFGLRMKFAVHRPRRERTSSNTRLAGTPLDSRLASS